MKKYVLALLFFLPFLATSSAYADTPQDVVYNFDSTTREALVCKNNDVNLPACSDYKYLKFETDFVISNVYNQNLVFSPNGSSKNVIPVNQTLDLSQITNLTQFFVGFSLLNGTNYTATVTLTNSNGCPAPEPCPECPLDCDDNLISRLFKSTFWEVATALVQLIVPVLALFLLFRLVHDLLWGKG